MCVKVFTQRSNQILREPIGVIPYKCNEWQSHYLEFSYCATTETPYEEKCKFMWQSIQASYFTRHQNIYLWGKPHKSNLRAKAFTQRSKVWDIRGFILESNLTNVVNVVGFSLNVYSFGIMTVHTGQKLYKYTQHWNTIKKLLLGSPKNSYWEESLQI